MTAQCQIDAPVTRRLFGSLSDGSPVEAVSLRNENGVMATIITYGATLQALWAPDRQGQVADIVLGHDTLEPYEQTPTYFGVTVGRYANRIAGGRFTLDGQTYQVPCNNPPNNLHGGPMGFDRQLWTITSITEGPIPSVTLVLDSPDGDMGFPGRVRTSATYELDGDNLLSITYEGVVDRPTILNMTNHAVFDLTGGHSPVGILNHRLTVPASHFTPVDGNLIPTGEVRPVADGPFDFREGQVVAAGLRDGRDEQIRAGRGYDHNFALDAGLTDRPKLAARLEEAISGRVLEVTTTEPGLQVYTGNFLDGTLIGKQGRLYRMGDGIALEPQKFPDAPNQPAFISARVTPDHPYRHVMGFRLLVA